MDKLYNTPKLSVIEIYNAYIICTSNTGVNFQDLTNGGNLPEENW